MNLITWLRSEWDRVAGFTLAGVGGLLVVVGGVAARGAPTTIDALSYIATAGLIGLFCTIVGVGMFVSADLHDEWHKLDRIEAAIRGEPLEDAETVLDLVNPKDRNGSAAGGPVVSGGADLVGTRPGPGSGFSAAVALNPGATRLLPAILLAPLAVLALGVGKASSSGEFSSAGQGIWIAAAAVAVAGAMIALLTRRERARVMERRTASLAPYLQAVTTFPPRGGTDGDDPHVWVGPGLRHFHRSGCAALAGVDATQMQRDDVGAGRVPCGLCGTGRR